MFQDIHNAALFTEFLGLVSVNNFFSLPSSSPFRPGVRVCVHHRPASSIEHKKTVIFQNKGFRTKLKDCIKKGTTVGVNPILDGA